MKCVERIDNGCGEVWCVDNFHKYHPELSKFMLAQCHTFSLDAQKFLDNQVHDIDESVCDEQLDHVLHLLASYNKHAVCMCRALMELYEPMVAEYMFVDHESNIKYSLDGNDVIEPLYGFHGATKQHKLIAATLYELNIQTNVTFMASVINFIDKRINCN